jgi:hypothetical protein
LRRFVRRTIACRPGSERGNGRRASKQGELKLPEFRFPLEVLT